MQGLMETVESHHENEQAGQRGVDEHGSGHLGQPPALPRFNPVLEPRYRRPHVTDGEARVTNGNPWVGVGGVPKFAVKAVDDVLGLVGLVAKDHHFTFVKVDLEPEHLLEAEEREFEVNLDVRKIVHNVPFRKLGMSVSRFNWSFRDRNIYFLHVRRFTIG
ncbi:hypothetical protein D1007_29760 [Hordeum vulgare]|nr:hypothetical protein D1007_29760 [Hordeum vulgare]